MTPSWTKMKDHPEQIRLLRSTARFRVVPAGRRSGKTELVGKRQMILRCMNCHDITSRYYSKFPDPKFFIGAPTRDQVKRIYWQDVKNLTPSWALKKKPNESQLILTFFNNTELHLLGMDRPERAEGSPWDGGVLDEYGNMHEETWPEHVRPALSDRNGTCDFIGVPEGRNHYYELYNKAKSRNAETLRLGLMPEWDTFWWISADILPPSEIRAAREDLDELTYQQEYEASFVNFSGRAYYPFLEQTHCRPLPYDEWGDLILMFDFNTAPGVAVVAQEMILPTIEATPGTGIIGEVYIPRASNTELVTRRLINDWPDHRGRIFVYGDYTGGAKTTAAIMGSDWEIIKRMLREHYGPDRTFFKLKPNPKERARVNAVNSRLMSMDGTVRMMVDPARAPKVVKDFEGVVLVEGGSGEIDKSSNPKLTHMTDAIGYYTWREFPITRTWQPMKERYWK